ncbi:MAG: glutamine ABC transporter ATP-binding protein GlnQ, partial [Polaromonas sp.]|nr:glutamine ABC transporter ATP-binding protein GlnQ [Polaromonas sp.]
MTDTMQSSSALAAGAEPIIRIEAVDKWFGKFQVLTDINLSVAAGERIVV